VNNKKLGDNFETLFSEMLAERGFWVHLLKQNNHGQPADLIAVRNNTSYLIDCKTCSARGFNLVRLEENQQLAMTRWKECGNKECWFALQLGEQVYMIPHKVIEMYSHQQSKLSPSEIFSVGKPFEKWVIKCR